jgi:uncharacterized membrane protein SirB2
MARVPIVCRWFLNATALIVPRHLRDEWRREWYGELWHFIDQRIESGDSQAYQVATAHCRGALADALYLRRNDEPSNLAVMRVVRHPAFAVGMLALLLVALAATTHGFESTRRMLGPLPYRQPEQVVVVRQVKPFMGGRTGFALAKIPGWRKAKTLDGIAAYAGYHALVQIRGSREVSAAVVDPEFFQVLGVKAQAGQLFQDIDPNHCVNCAVVSDELWRSDLGGDRAAIGRTYKIAGQSHKVIGVLPRGFWFFTDTPQVWTLISHSTFVDPKTALVYAIARLRPGVSEKASLGELRSLYRTLPPRIRARQVEEVRIGGLLQDPLYRLLPVVLTGLLLIAGIAVLALPHRKTSIRAAAFFTAKASLISLWMALAAIEFAYAPGMLMTGVRGFGPEVVTLWLVIFGIVIAVWWAWDDQRKRCPACLSRLSMPVQMGSRGHVLMEWMSTELVCPNGHGMLWAPEDPLESHPKDKWLNLDESWQDLFAISDKTN